ncbi:universal stress protein [Marinobacter sp. X15-166B]|uniref:universal stress protein n=1 Tax=Marinobacter sp. X15-166B TaxID=1897620 RepID=UPI0009F7470C|nr:universal stress protein [Marinobacter sp. X15-166B]
MSHVVGCIDRSRAAVSVCDYAAWASLRLAAPLMLFHVTDQERYPAPTDLAGNIGLGSREHLLEELASLDEQRGKLALEHGQHLLQAAEQRVREAGVRQVHQRQRHGSLSESLLAIEADTRLLVIGLHGESSNDGKLQVGSQLETVIRSVTRPVMVVPDEFTAPRSAMLAFDGSDTALKGVQVLAASPLLEGLPLHLVMVGEDSAERQQQLESARSVLAPLGCELHVAIREGEVETALHQYQAEHHIDLLIMGAYGHSRIRQFLVGSTTTNMLKTATTPLIILR